MTDGLLVLVQLVMAAISTRRGEFAINRSRLHVNRVGGRMLGSHLAFAAQCAAIFLAAAAGMHLAAGGHVDRRAAVPRLCRSRFR